MNVKVRLWVSLNVFLNMNIEIRNCSVGLIYCIIFMVDSCKCLVVIVNRISGIVVIGLVVNSIRMF